ncbi:MAG: hypothetical protein R3F34_18300 [Planctomycetota bacterium]
MAHARDWSEALEASDASPQEIVRRCARLARRMRGDALAWWPGSPWREPVLAAPLLWLALLEHGFEREEGGGASNPLVGELAAILARARDGGARTVLGRALALTLGRGAWDGAALDEALGAARALEHGGTFATRRALAERAVAWSGGTATAWARLASGGRERHVEELRTRIEAGLAAERLARWTADPAGQLASGRLVVPVDELARANLAVTVLAESPTDARIAALVASQVGWIRGFLARAWPAVELAGVWRGRALALWLGGVERCLRRIESRRFEVARRAVAPPRANWLALARFATPEGYRELA